MSLTQKTSTALAIIRYCMGCGRPTTGSIGQAGYYWPRVCQPCKDEADGALRVRVTNEAKTFRFIEDALSRARQPIQNHEVIG